MSNKQDANIADLIRELVKPLLHIQAFPAKVKSVNRDKQCCTVTPLHDGPDIFNVRLTATVKAKDSMMLIIPKVDSDVVVAIMSDNPNVCYVAQFSDVEEILLNGDDHGGIGLTKVIAERIARLEKDLEKLAGAYNKHTHGIASSEKQVQINYTVKTSQGDISSKKVKHG